MRAADIKSNYKDQLAAKRRQHFVRTATGLFLVVAVGLVLIGYGLFFTNWFTIRDITVTGLQTDHANQVTSAINIHLGERFLGLPTGRNILFLSSGSLKDALLKEFSFIDQADVNKKFFHGLLFSAVERKPQGIWCFNPPSGACKFFDQTGFAWGEAVRSSGTLFLNVDDFRVPASTSDQHIVDRNFLTAIQTVITSLHVNNIIFSNITIPSSSVVEFDVQTATGYPLRFSLDSNLQGQLTVFQIFKQKQIDTNLISPQYLDLRYDGRVYYK